MVMLYPWNSRCGAKERKANATRKAKAGIKTMTKPSTLLDTVFSAKIGRHMKKDCWWNANAKNGKDTAPLETPITPAEITKTEPPITGMLIQSDDGGEIRADPAQWLYSCNGKRICS